MLDNTVSGMLSLSDEMDGGGTEVIKCAWGKLPESYWDVFFQVLNLVKFVMYPTVHHPNFTRVAKRNGRW